MSADLSMGATLSEKGRAALAFFHAKWQNKADPFAVEWASMAGAERRHWLHYARLGPGLAACFYDELSEAQREAIKNAIRRAGKRAEALKGAL